MFNPNYQITYVEDMMKDTTHWSQPPVCPDVFPVRWGDGGRSTCRLQSLQLSGCLATGTRHWRTPLVWAAEFSGRGCGIGSPLCHSPVATATLCTGTYWLRRWGEGHRPLLAPPAGLHWSLLGHLRRNRKQEHEQNINLLISCVMNQSPQLLDTSGSCLLPETHTFSANSTKPPCL